MCKQFSQRPSSYLKLSGSWLQFDFDHAVAAFGITVQNRLDAVDKEGNHTYKTIDEALGLPRKRKPIPRSLLGARGVLGKG